jgi:hypothetical protein
MTEADAAGGDAVMALVTIEEAVARMREIDASGPRHGPRRHPGCAGGVRAGASGPRHGCGDDPRVDRYC